MGEEVECLYQRYIHTCLGKYSLYLEWIWNESERSVMFRWTFSRKTGECEASSRLPVEVNLDGGLKWKELR